MNHTVFNSHLTSYLAGVAIGGVILASALAGVGGLSLERAQAPASTLMCSDQANSVRVEALKAQVVAAQA